MKQSQEEAEAERLEDELLACQVEQRYPEDWAPYSAPDGQTHFRHRLSGRSRWTLPAGASRGGVKRKKEEEAEDEEGSLTTSLTILSSFALFDWPSDSFRVVQWSLVSGSQLFDAGCLCSRSTLRRFLGDDFRICRIKLFLWFDSRYVFTSVYGGVVA